VVGDSVCSAPSDGQGRLGRLVDDPGSDGLAPGPRRETVTERLLEPFGLDHERPHARDGLHGRLAAKVGLHITCLWLNRHLGRPDLAVATLIDW